VLIQFDSDKFSSVIERAKEKGNADIRSGDDTDFADLVQYFHGGGVFSVAMCAEMKFSRHFTVACGIISFGRPLASQQPPRHHSPKFLQRSVT
jgi:hypothetical protein